MKYVEIKITITCDVNHLSWVKFKKSVLVHKLVEEQLHTYGSPYKLLVFPGQVLIKRDRNGLFQGAIVKLYRSASASCVLMMQRLQPDIFNAAHGLIRHLTASKRAMSVHW